MTTKFKELDLDLIQQGEILEQFNKQFAKVQDQVVKHIEKYGDGAAGATAAITLKIELKVAEITSKTIALLPEIKLTSPPVMPKKKTFAMGGDTQDGRKGLFVGVTGSHEDSPNQAILEYPQDDPKSE